jgi:hypothetical protein
MQSFLQYRRFGRHLQRQLERDRARSEKRNEDQNGTQSPPATNEIDPPLIEEEIEKDLERDLETGNPRLELTLSNSSDSTAVYSSASESEDEETSPNSLHGINTTGTQLGVSLTGIDVRSRTTIEGKELGKVFVVGYEGEKDPLNPHNWPLRPKIIVTANIAAIAMIVGFASSIDSAAIPQASKEFGVSDVTEALATGLFLIGFGCGGLVSGPISETVGRNPVYIGTLLIYMIFVMASGLARSIGEQLAFRFIAGVFAATPLTTAGGSLSDIWSPLERVYAFPMLYVPF